MVGRGYHRPLPNHVPLTHPWHEWVCVSEASEYRAHAHSKVEGKLRSAARTQTTAVRISGFAIFRHNNNQEAVMSLEKWHSLDCDLPLLNLVQRTESGTRKAMM